VSNDLARPDHVEVELEDESIVDIPLSPGDTAKSLIARIRHHLSFDADWPLQLQYQPVPNKAIRLPISGDDDLSEALHVTGASGGVLKIFITEDDTAVKTSPAPTTRTSTATTKSRSKRNQKKKNKKKNNAKNQTSAVKTHVSESSAPPSSLTPAAPAESNIPALKDLPLGPRFTPLDPHLPLAPPAAPPTLSSGGLAPVRAPRKVASPQQAKVTDEGSESSSAPRASSVKDTPKFDKDIDSLIDDIFDSEVKALPYSGPTSTNISLKRAPGNGGGVDILDQEAIKFQQRGAPIGYQDFDPLDPKMQQFMKQILKGGVSKDAEKMRWAISGEDKEIDSAVQAITSELGSSQFKSDSAAANQASAQKSSSGKFGSLPRMDDLQLQPGANFMDILKARQQRAAQGVRGPTEGSEYDEDFDDDDDDVEVDSGAYDDDTFEQEQVEEDEADERRLKRQLSLGRAIEGTEVVGLIPESENEDEYEDDFVSESKLGLKIASAQKKVEDPITRAGALSELMKFSRAANEFLSTLQDLKEERVKAAPQHGRRAGKPAAATPAATASQTEQLLAAFAAQQKQIETLATQMDHMKKENSRLKMELQQSAVILPERASTAFLFGSAMQINSQCSSRSSSSVSSPANSPQPKPAEGKNSLTEPATLVSRPDFECGSEEEDAKSNCVIS